MRLSAICEVIVTQLLPTDASFMQHLLQIVQRMKHDKAYTKGHYYDKNKKYLAPKTHHVHLKQSMF